MSLEPSYLGLDLQALGVPSDTFKQAAARKAQLREEGRLDVLPAPATPPGAVSMPPETVGLDGGTVAAALDLMLHGGYRYHCSYAARSHHRPDNTGSWVALGRGRGLLCISLPGHEIPARKCRASSACSLRVGAFLLGRVAATLSQTVLVIPPLCCRQS